MDSRGNTLQFEVSSSESAPNAKVARVSDKSPRVPYPVQLRISKKDADALVGHIKQLRDTLCRATGFGQLYEYVVRLHPRKYTVDRWPDDVRFF